MRWWMRWWCLPCVVCGGCGIGSACFSSRRSCVASSASLMEVDAASHEKSELAPAAHMRRRRRGRAVVEDSYAEATLMDFDAASQEKSELAPAAHMRRRRRGRAVVEDPYAERTLMKVDAASQENSELAPAAHMSRRRVLKVSAPPL